MSSAAEIASEFFRAWADGDFFALREVLADDVVLESPSARQEGVDPCIAALRRVSQLMNRLDVLASVAQGEQVMTFYEVHSAEAPHVIIASWMTIADERLSRIRVVYDPRAFVDVGL